MEFIFPRQTPDGFILAAGGIKLSEERRGKCFMVGMLDTCILWSQACP